jgi:hypothetical protein
MPMLGYSSSELLSYSPNSALAERTRVLASWHQKGDNPLKPIFRHSFFLSSLFRNIARYHLIRGDSAPQFERILKNNHGNKICCGTLSIRVARFICHSRRFICPPQTGPNPGSSRLRLHDEHRLWARGRHRIGHLIGRNESLPVLSHGKHRYFLNVPAEIRPKWPSKSTFSESVRAQL